MEYTLELNTGISPEDPFNHVSTFDNDSASSFVKADVQRDANVHDVQLASGSFDDQWGFVNSPEFSVHNFTIPHMDEDESSRDIGCNPLYDMSDHTGTARVTRTHRSETTRPDRNLTRNSSAGSLNLCPSPRHENSQTLWYDSTIANDHHSLPLHLSSHQSSRDSVASKEDTDFETNDKISNSVKSMWNNFKNGFTLQLKTDFKYDSPIWLLGKFYHCSKDEREQQKKAHNKGSSFMTNMDEFKIDFSSRLWFTYRRGFAPLPNSSLTSDVGWGCMLRSGQMMLAHGLILHLLGRDWRCQIRRSNEDLIRYRKIVQFFADIYSRDCPFSIHRLVEIGLDHGKKPGDWFGPSSVAHVMSKAMLDASRHILLADLCIYVAQDCTVYLQDVIDMCSKDHRSAETSTEETHGSSQACASNGTSALGSNNTSWRACVILIPVRLGGVDLNEVYVPCLKNLLAYNCCLGIIGGKPKHSLYFIGWQEDKAIYLDPHFCQEMVDPRPIDTPLESFHCSAPRKMSFSKLDPSCTIGFYCRTRDEFELFVADAKKMCFPPMEKQPYPMFVFQNGHSITAEQSINDPPERDRVLKVRHFDKEGRAKPLKESDDFVFLEA